MHEQNAEPRTTEGPRPGGVSRGKASTRRGGRPVGAKNKPKSLVPQELANKLLLEMKDQLPPEHFAYLKGVIKDGKAISTRQELDTLVLLLSRNLYPALIAETKGPSVIEGVGAIDEETAKALGPVFRRDVTERLKVLNSLLSLRNQIEKRDESKPDLASALVNTAIDRGFDRGRFAILLGFESGVSVGDADGAGWGADAARTVSDQVSERPLALPSGEQE